jgi:hypothetical protein
MDATLSEKTNIAGLAGKYLQTSRSQDVLIREG